MTENYGDCSRCGGYGVVIDNNAVMECSRCGGTGMSGSSADYNETEARKDPNEQRIINQDIRKPNNI